MHKTKNTLLNKKIEDRPRGYGGRKEKTMKKKEIQDLIDGIKRKRTGTLRGIICTIDRWDENHKCANASYFWSPPRGASERRSYEQRRTWEEDLKIGNITLQYESSCSCSCQNIYWRDYLTHDAGEDVKINFGDLRKIKDAIEEIIDRRGV